MDIAKKVTLITAALIFFTLAIVGIGYYYKDWYVAYKYAKDNNLVFCGYKNNSDDNTIGACILNAFDTCTPAYAVSESDGVSWEASGFSKSIEVTRGTNGDCGVRYIATGQSFLGPYSHNSFCRSLQQSEYKVVGGENVPYVKISSCDSIDKPESF